MTCQNLGCDRNATVRVSGGKMPGETFGWQGVHCTEHALGVVTNQIFQVEAGMPITITPIAPWL